MIDVTDLVVSYGAATALDHVTLSVRRGRDGGAARAERRGQVDAGQHAGRAFSPRSPGPCAIGGRLALIPEGRQLFPDMTVADNLALGGWRSGQRDPSAVYELLPRLAELAGRRAGVLSGGEQQMVAFGRAMMARPEVLVVDELSLGLAPTVTADLAAHLAELNREHGLTVLLIEQNARLAFELCHRAYVLESGRLVAEGESAELAEDPRVASAYLGGAIT